VHEHIRWSGALLAGESSTFTCRNGSRQPTRSSTPRNSTYVASFHLTAILAFEPKRLLELCILSAATGFGLFARAVFMWNITTSLFLNPDPRHASLSRVLFFVTRTSMNHNRAFFLCSAPVGGSLCSPYTEIDFLFACKHEARLRFKLWQCCKSWSSFGIPS
jgi:hypothetical protein